MGEDIELVGEGVIGLGRMLCFLWTIMCWLRNMSGWLWRLFGFLVCNVYFHSKTIRAFSTDKSICKKTCSIR